jgi:hypothetical protein
MFLRFSLIPEDQDSCEPLVIYTRQQSRDRVFSYQARILTSGETIKHSMRPAFPLARESAETQGSSWTASVPALLLLSFSFFEAYCTISRTVCHAQPGHDKLISFVPARLYAYQNAAVLRMSPFSRAGAWLPRTSPGLESGSLTPCILAQTAGTDLPMLPFSAILPRALFFVREAHSDTFP